MKNAKNKLTNYGAEIFAYLLIIATGVVLISSYWQFETIDSSYQDWMYHAFRIRRLLEVGLTSWDHVWANGINHWRGYQYLPHATTALLSYTTGASITQAMIYIVTSTFVLSRVIMYALMRQLKARRLYSILAVLLTFTFVQQWQMILDFSIYTSIILVPFLIWLFARSFSSTTTSVIFAAFSSFAYLVHPLAGIVFAPLFAVTLFFDRNNRSRPSRLLRMGIYLTISSPFYIQHLLKPYAFVNPILSTAEFARNTLPFPYLGFNLAYVLLILLAWILITFRRRQYSGWVQWLLLYSTIGVFAVFAAYHDWLPNILAQLQLSRTNNFFGYIFPFVLGYILSRTFGSIRSRFLTTILIILAGIMIINSVEIGSRYMTSPIITPSSPVSYWFSNSQTSPLVYYANDSEAALYADAKVRFAGSYNEHLLPSPVSLRFKRLLKLATTFDTQSIDQLNLIDNYSQVLGVDYYILPSKSAFVSSLINLDNYQIVDTTTTDRGEFTLVKRTTPHYNAYLYHRSQHEYLTDSLPANPTDNYEDWDHAITTLANAMTSQQMTPLQLDFVSTSELHVQIPEHEQGSSLLITQSYDPNWTTTGELSATSLNHLTINHISDSFQGELILTNNWPLWYWLVNGISIFSFVSILISILAIKLIRRFNST